MRKGVTHCVVYSDDMGTWNEDFFKYDGILIGTPVYEMGITPQLCGFLSRFRSEYLNHRDNPDLRLYMPGAALAVGGTRNGGQECAINIILGLLPYAGNAGG